MDWLQWIPTPLASSRKTADAQRRKEAQRRKDRRVALDRANGRPLVFQTSEDACLCRATSAVTASPVLLGLGDGSRGGHLPSALLGSCQHIAEAQLVQPSGRPGVPQQEEATGASPRPNAYQGPISLLKDAFKATESFGSTTVALAVLDNSTVIHGQLHPMVAMLSLGSCQLLQLRRRDVDKSAAIQAVPQAVSPERRRSCAESLSEASTAATSPEGCSSVGSPASSDALTERAPSSPEEVPATAGALEVVFLAPPRSQQEPVEGDQRLATPRAAQLPTVVLGRDVMGTDVDLCETLQAIEDNSSVQCASARQGDIVILVSSGLLEKESDALDGFVEICNEMLPPSCGSDFSPTSPELLRRLAQRIGNAATRSTYTDEASPTEEEPPVLGSVVVAEVVEWVPDDSENSFSSGCRAATPDKANDIYADAVVTDGEALLSKIGPSLEGLDETKSLNCSLGFGEYGVSVQVEIPRVQVPRWPLQRTLTNDLISELQRV